MSKSVAFAKAKPQVKTQPKPKKLPSIKQEVINHLLIIDIYERDKNDDVNKKQTRCFIYKPANNIIRKVINDQFNNEDRTIDEDRAISDIISESFKDTTKYKVIKFLNLFGYFRDNNYFKDKQRSRLLGYRALIEYDESDTSDESIIDDEFNIDINHSLTYEDNTFNLCNIGKVKEVSQFKLFRKGAFNVHYRPYFIEHRNDYKERASGSDSDSGSSDNESEETKEKVVKKGE